MTIFTDGFTGSNGTTALSTGWTAFGLGANAAVIQSNALAVAGASTYADYMVGERNGATLASDADKAVNPQFDLQEAA